MNLVVIALVCSAFVSRADCVLDNSLRHQRLELLATNDVMCEFNGMVAAAQVMHVDPSLEYVKVMCVRPSIEVGHMPG